MYSFWIIFVEEEKREKRKRSFSPLFSFKFFKFFSVLISFRFFHFEFFFRVVTRSQIRLLSCSGINRDWLNHAGDLTDSLTMNIEAERLALQQPARRLARCASVDARPSTISKSPKSPLQPIIEAEEDSESSPDEKPSDLFELIDSDPEIYIHGIFASRDIRGIIRR